MKRYFGKRSFGGKMITYILLHTNSTGHSVIGDSLIGRRTGIVNGVNDRVQLQLIDTDQSTAVYILCTGGTGSFRQQPRR